MTKETRKHMVSSIFYNYKDAVLETGQAADEVLGIAEDLLKELAFETDEEIEKRYNMIEDK